MIVSSIPNKKIRRKHPAAKIFQAIRIHVNNEIEEIKSILNSIIEMLSNKGRISIISFHSLEDRLIKSFIRKFSKKNYNDEYYKNIRKYEYDFSNKKLKSFKKIKPSKIEQINNPRSRSAILRFAEKI